MPAIHSKGGAQALDEDSALRSGCRALLRLMREQGPSSSPFPAIVSPRLAAAVTFVLVYVGRHPLETKLTFADVGLALESFLTQYSCLQKEDLFDERLDGDARVGNTNPAKIRALCRALIQCPLFDPVGGRNKAEPRAEKARRLAVPHPKPGETDAVFLARQLREAAFDWERRYFANGEAESQRMKKLRGKLREKPARRKQGTLTAPVVSLSGEEAEAMLRVLWQWYHTAAAAAAEAAGDGQAHASSQPPSVPHSPQQTQPQVDDTTAHGVWWCEQQQQQQLDSQPVDNQPLLPHPFLVATSASPLALPLLPSGGDAQVDLPTGRWGGQQLDCSPSAFLFAEQPRPRFPLPSTLFGRQLAIGEPTPPHGTHPPHHPEPPPTTDKEGHPFPFCAYQTGNDPHSSLLLDKFVDRLL